MALVLVGLGLAWGVHAAPKTFTVAAEDYPPFTDSHLPSQGWTWAVVKAAMESQGYRVSLSLVPWARALQEVRLGRRDALLNAYWSRDRLPWLTYSQPIGVVKARFYRRVDRPDPRFGGDFTKLKPYRIGAVRGYTLGVAFDQADLPKKETVTRTEDGLMQLLFGRIDLLASGDLGNGSTILQRLEREYPGMRGKIVAVEPLIDVQHLHVAVSKAAPGADRKLEDLNIGLRQILLDGRYRKILKAHGVTLQ